MVTHARFQFQFSNWLKCVQTKTKTTTAISFNYPRNATFCWLHTWLWASSSLRFIQAKVCKHVSKSAGHKMKFVSVFCFQGITTCHVPKRRANPKETELKRNPIFLQCCIFPLPSTLPSMSLMWSKWLTAYSDLFFNDKWQGIVLHQVQYMKRVLTPLVSTGTRKFRRSTFDVILTCIKMWCFWNPSCYVRYE